MKKPTATVEYSGKPESTEPSIYAVEVTSADRRIIYFSKKLNSRRRRIKS